jgi:hypothetical protein
MWRLTPGRVTFSPWPPDSAHHETTEAAGRRRCRCGWDPKPAPRGRSPAVQRRGRSPANLSQTTGSWPSDQALDDRFRLGGGPQLATASVTRGWPAPRTPNERFRRAGHVRPFEAGRVLRHERDRRSGVVADDPYRPSVVPFGAAEQALRCDSDRRLPSRSCPARSPRRHESRAGPHRETRPEIRQNRARRATRTVRSDKCPGANSRPHSCKHRSSHAGVGVSAAAVGVKQQPSWRPIQAAGALKRWLLTARCRLLPCRPCSRQPGAAASAGGRHGAEARASPSAADETSGGS